jgi:Tfp pilus assembly protein PilP
MKKIVLVVSCLAMVGCLRLRQGEDITTMTREELEKVAASIEYISDARTELCFAVINNYTDGFRNTFVIANVQCDKVNKFVR